MGTNYYARTDTCEHCGRGADSLHIGKNMRIVQALFWNDPPIDTFAGWREFLARPGVTVWDEYGRQIEDVPAWLDEWEHYESRADWGMKDPYASTYSEGGDWLDPDGYHMCRADFT